MFRFTLVVTAILTMAFLMGCNTSPDPVPVVETVAATAVAASQPSPTAIPTIPPPPAITIAAPASPTPIATDPPSPTPIATETPLITDTPVATDTPVPSDTPPPTATFVPQPTLPPTDTPTPLPTPNSFGLTASFLVEGGPAYAVNQDIWFQFDVKNPNGTEIKYGALGLFPRKDGVDRLDMFQYSWTNATMFPNGLVWRDHINISEPGEYMVRIAICFNETKGECQSPSANWVTLSPYELLFWVQ